MLINFCINRENSEHRQVQNLFETNPFCVAATDAEAAGNSAPARLLRVCGTAATGAEKPGGPAVPPARDTAPPRPPVGIPGWSQAVSGKRWGLNRRRTSLSR